MQNKLFRSAMNLFIGVLFFSLWGCYPNDSLTTAELDIVATDYDEDFFNRVSLQSYHLPDTVGVIGEGDAQLDGAAMDFILAQVRRNLNDLGYEEKSTIDDNDMPDVIVTVSALKEKFVGVGCLPWYDWWGWYPWYPGWGWGGGYCYPSYAYSYETGTLLIDMISPDESTDDSFKRVWEAGINGLIRSDQIGNQQFVRSTIDQAFEQSPYLN